MLRAKTVHPWHRNSLIFYFLKPLCCRAPARTASLALAEGRDVAQAAASRRDAAAEALRLEGQP